MGFNKIRISMTINFIKESGVDGRSFLLVVEKILIKIYNCVCNSDLFSNHKW